MNTHDKIELPPLHDAADLLRSYLKLCKSMPSIDNRYLFRIARAIDAIEADRKRRCEPVGWIYEDDLPTGYPYDDMYPFSKVDGVRLFPVFWPETVLTLGYMEGHRDGLEWAAQLAEANHPLTGDWLYDDPHDLAKAIRKGPEMPPVDPQPTEPVKCPICYEDEPHTGTCGSSDPKALCNRAEPVKLNKVTQDQVASVMLQTGTPEQQAAALRYCRVEPVKVPGDLYPPMPDRSKWTLCEEITSLTPIDREGGPDSNEARYIITAAQLDRLERIESALLASYGQPAQPAGVVAALDWIDDFIARCNGDDRGACESVNVLRRAMAASAALRALEQACDDLARLRTHEQYLSMIDIGQQDALEALDAARRSARAILAVQPAASAEPDVVLRVTHSEHEVETPEVVTTSRQFDNLPHGTEVKLYAAPVAAQPSVPDTIYLGCARMGMAGASDEEVLNYVRVATQKAATPQADDPPPKEPL